MSKGAQTKLVHSNKLPEPNIYVKAMYGEYVDWAVDEDTALKAKGEWRSQVFKSSPSSAFHLEIGPGSGRFLLHIAQENPTDLFSAIELKYKPLIQTCRKLKRGGLKNAKVTRYNARMLEDIFAPKELSNVYIHFPDPWPKKRHHKHRLINLLFIKSLYQLQKAGSFLEIKTDHEEYFDEIVCLFKKSAYQNTEYSRDYHKDERLRQNNFMTLFETIFLKKNLPIYYLKYLKV